MDPAKSPTKVSSLDLDPRIIKHLKQQGITTLHPPQAMAIGPALEGKNLLLATPTASGKSLIAYLAILQKLRNAESGERAFYIVPLKALANEKVDELRNLADTVGLSVGIAIGDRDGESGGIENSDIVVCTSEKLDSILRNNPTFSERLSIIIADEFHLINDSSRGPTLEVLLARLRHLNPNAQRIALSATVGNPQELAKWLDAHLIESEWRPVNLQQGTLTGLELEIHRIIGPKNDSELPPRRILEGKETKITNSILNDTISDGGQMILFVGTRSSAEKEARELGKMRVKNLSSIDEFKEEFDELEKLSKKISKGEDSSNLSDRLSNSVKGGVAFHHAGLTGRQRMIIEQAFRDRL
ncbi:MAG: DEAD/DEAH box helicase, partial [Candidatus Thermoplasmatota archaeon]|nr:DEAD/DEAH box helicase [Candidatus Thermoplasmatota archaeon]